MNRLPPRPLSALTVLSVAVLLSGCARHRAEPNGDAGPSTTPKFETRIEIDTGAGSHADFVVADLNNDAKVDLAVVSLSGELQVLLGSGSVWSLGQSLNLGGVPVWLGAGDLDGDGDRDLAVLRTDAGEVSVLVNDGNAQFSPGPTPVLQVGPDALQVLVADADDDQLLDLIVSRPYAPEILVFRGDGAGGFTPATPLVLPRGGAPFTIALGDVTRDQHLDLVIADPYLHRVLVFAGTGTLDFETDPLELEVLGGPRACSVGDVDGDGLSDIAVSAFEDHRFVVITGIDLPPGGSGPTTYQSFAVPVGGPASVSTIGDVTGDGRNDLIACVLGRSAVVVAPQLPGGGLGEPFHLDASGIPLRPVLADADRNGRNDLFVLSGLNDRLNLWLSRNEGGLVGSRSWDAEMFTAAYVGATDLDGDGQPEAIVGNNHDTWLSIMKYREPGVLEVARTVELGSTVFNVRMADLDRDGRMDLVVPVMHGVKVLHNESTQAGLAFEVEPAVGSTSYGVGNGPFGVAVTDLDRDGNLDLAIASHGSGQLQILRGGPVPFEFGQATLLSIGDGPVDVVAGEFTGDGIVDLAVSRAGMADIAIFRNDGAGNLTLLVALPVGLAPNYLLTADFDADGRQDIVVSNGHGDSVSVLFGGAQGFRMVEYPAGRTPTALFAGDMTNDGSPDILVTSLVAGDFRVLVNDGMGGFGNVLAFPGANGASSAALADVDADGDRDLLIGNIVTSRVSLVRSIDADR